LPGLFLPLLSVPAFERLGTRTRLAALAALLVLNLAHTEPKGYVTFDDEYYAPASIAEKGINTTTREEYTPRAARLRPPFAKTKLTAIQGRVALLDERLTSARQDFRVRVEHGTPAVAELATFHYPGWTATIDGRETALTVVPVRGTMALTLPPGEHDVRLELRPTPVRRWSGALSVAALLMLAAAGARHIIAVIRGSIRAHCPS
jgi:hypothetical protein